MRLCSCLLLLFVSSCVSASAFKLGETYYDPWPAGHPVILYDTLEDVDLEHVKVARIVGTGSSSASWDRIMGCMIDKARQVGADAMVLGIPGRMITGIDDQGNVCHDRLLSALAIRWAYQRP